MTEDHGIARRTLFAAAGWTAPLAGAGAMAGGGLIQSALASPRPPTGASFDVRALGARGDGETDDSGAFATAAEAVSASGGIVFVPPGLYRVGDLDLPSATLWQGVPGGSILKYNGRRSIFTLRGRSDVVFNGLTFDGDDRAPLEDDALVLVADGSERILFDSCIVQDSEDHGIFILDSAATIRNCALRRIGFYGIKVDSREEVRILGNTIEDIDNNGIRLQRPREESVRTMIADNHIKRVESKDGGTGRNGNGINIWRCHDVMIRGNHITDCAYSAIRTNAGDGCQIIGNHCTGCRETTVFVEFGAAGTVIMGNYFEDPAQSDDSDPYVLQIVNFSDDGRLATCMGNIFKNANSRAIKVEADTIIQGNIIDGARTGITVGYGPYLRNVVVDGNLIQDTRPSPKLEHGILVSRHGEAGTAFLSNNRIFNHRRQAIIGHDHHEPVRLGSNVMLANNYPGLASSDMPAAAVGGSTNYEPDTGAYKVYRDAGPDRGWSKIR